MFITLLAVPEATEITSRTTSSCGTPSANRVLRVNLKGIDVSDLKVEKHHGG